MKEAVRRPAPIPIGQVRRKTHPEVSALLFEIRERKAADYRALMELSAGFELMVLDQPDERRGANGGLGTLVGTSSAGGP